MAGFLRVWGVGKRWFWSRETWIKRGYIVATLWFSLVVILGDWQQRNDGGRERFASSKNKVSDAARHQVDASLSYVQIISFRRRICSMPRDEGDPIF
jgi:hypothetical protein